MCGTYRGNVAEVEGVVDLQLLVQVLVGTHGEQEGGLEGNLADVVVPSRGEHTCKKNMSHATTASFCT